MSEVMETIDERKKQEKKDKKQKRGFCNNHQPQMVRITSRAATTCPKSGIERPGQHCVKYAQIRVSSEPYFPVY